MFRSIFIHFCKGLFGRINRFTEEVICESLLFVEDKEEYLITNTTPVDEYLFVPDLLTIQKIDYQFD